MKASALYSAACACLAPVAPLPVRELPERMPEGLPVEVYHAWLKREAVGVLVLGRPVEIRRASLEDPEDAPALAVALRDPSAAWLVRERGKPDRLHLVATDGRREAEVVLERDDAGRLRTVRGAAGSAAAAARGVMVYRGNESGR